MMTEAEAKTKWCPFVRIAGVRHPAAQCIASACMAWRWTMTPEEAKGNVNGPRGYCGLAGVPE